MLWWLYVLIIFSKPHQADKAAESEKNTKGALCLLAVIILVSAYVVAFASRLFAVIRFESIIHEFDPW